MSGCQQLARMSDYQTHTHTLCFLVNRPTCLLLFQVRLVPEIKPLGIVVVCFANCIVSASCYSFLDQELVPHLFYCSCSDPFKKARAAAGLLGWSLPLGLGLEILAL